MNKCHPFVAFRPHGRNRGDFSPIYEISAASHSENGIDFRLITSHVFQSCRFSKCRQMDPIWDMFENPQAPVIDHQWKMNFLSVVAR
jgi:hypothetical protein